MSVSKRHTSLRDRRIRSANDLLKDRWQGRMAWSTVAAVFLHAGIFFFWPSWEREAIEREDELELTPIELIAFYEQLSGRGDLGTAAVPVSEIPDSLPVEAELQDAGEGSEADLASLSQALQERLRRRGGIIPRVVEREPEPEVVSEAPEEGEGDSTEIGGEASSTAALTALPEPDALALDRLSAVRPELAILAPSNWVLIRNPTEVEQFMRRPYLRGELDRSDEGMVSVALWINERGGVEWAEVNESSGQPTMDELALELFSEVVAFRPARDEGVPVSRSVVFSIRFPWF